MNQGRCGECGDEWNLPRPRLHDEGGMYGTGTIGAHLKQGEVICKQPLNQNVTNSDRIRRC